LARDNGQLHSIQRWNNNTEFETVLYREVGVHLSTYKTILEDTPEYTIGRATGPMREQLTRFKINTYSNMAGQPGWNNNPFGTMGQQHHLKINP
jgi:hypothetical protein